MPKFWKNGKGTRETIHKPLNHKRLHQSWGVLKCPAKLNGQAQNHDKKHGAKNGLIFGAIFFVFSVDFYTKHRYIYGEAAEIPQNSNQTPEGERNNMNSKP